METDKLTLSPQQKQKLNQCNKILIVKFWTTLHKLVFENNHPNPNPHSQQRMPHMDPMHENVMPTSSLLDHNNKKLVVETFS